MWTARPGLERRSKALHPLGLREVRALAFGAVLEIALRLSRRDPRKRS